MPCCATSSATVFVSPAMPCLAATYADLYGLATSACADAMLMMRPHCFAFILGSARRMVWNDAVRLSARIASHLAVGNSSIGATCWMPALLTSTSTAPNSAIALPIMPSDRVLLREVGAVVADLARRLLGKLADEPVDLARVAEAVEDDVRAVRDERAGYS